MGQTTYTLEGTATISVSGCEGDLRVEGHDGPTVVVRGDEMPSAVRQQDGMLVIENCDGDLHLRMPFDAIVQVHHVNGDLSAERVARLETGDVHGDVHVSRISAGCTLGAIHGDATLADLVNLSAEDLHGDVHISRVGGTLDIGAVHGDLELQEISAACTLHDVHGDAQISNTANLMLSGRVGGDLVIRAVKEGRLEINAVDGDLDLQAIAAPCTVGDVGGDVQASGIAALALSGTVSGDVHIHDLSRGVLEISNVSGDLDLEKIRTRCIVRDVDGDATATDMADLTCEGSVGGDLRLERITEGRLELPHIGGDLHLRAIGAPCTIGDIGGDAEIDGVGDFTLLGSVGGDLRLHNVRGKLSLRRESIGGDIEMDAPPHTAVTGQPAGTMAAASPVGPSDAGAKAVRLAVLHSLEHGEISVEEAMLLLAHA